MQVVGLIVYYQDPTTAGYSLKERLRRVNPLRRWKPKHLLNRVCGWGRLPLIKGLNISKGKNTRGCLRNRIFAKAYLELEVISPLGRHNRVIIKDAAVLKVLSQAFVHDRFGAMRSEV